MVPEAGQEGPSLLAGPHEAAERTREKDVMKKLVTLVAGILIAPAIMTAQLPKQRAAAHSATGWTSAS